MTVNGFTEDEVAQRAGTTPEHIRQLAELGILEPEDGTYPRRDVLRARFVLGLDAIGIDANAVADGVASGDLTLGYVEFGGRRPPRSDQTFDELGEEIGIPYPMLERLYVAFGLPRPAPDEYVREEDLRLLKIIPVLFGAGVGEGEILRLARVWGDSARRVAQFQNHYLHHSIEEPFRRRGLRDNEAFEAALMEVSVRAGRSGEDLLGWLFGAIRRCSKPSISSITSRPLWRTPGSIGREPRQVEACAFADLSGYTRLTEEAGDEVAAQVSVKLAELVNEVASRHAGAVVKMLGDGVLFHFKDPQDAVMASLEILDRVRPAGLPRRTSA